MKRKQSHDECMYDFISITKAKHYVLLLYLHLFNTGIIIISTVK